MATVGRRRALLVLLQCLPLLGLGGCAALWTAVPVDNFLRQASTLSFWGFFALAGLGAVAALTWGLGYLYLGRRERLGCALLLLGPLFVIWSYGYAFDGFAISGGQADELARRRAMLLTAALCAVPVALLTWDAWRLGGAPAGEGDTINDEKQ